MAQTKQFILVDRAVVPDVFLRVLEAKQLFSIGKAKTFSEACKMAKLSRTAFYKYRHTVFLQESNNEKTTIALYLRLSDTPGMLSSVLSQLSGKQVNILTVYQNIPVDGVADVTITIQWKDDGFPVHIHHLLDQLKQMDGVFTVHYF